MFSRVARPMSAMVRRVSATSALKPVNAVRVFSVKGAPPVSVDDLYSLCYMSEPKFKSVDRQPEDMFKTDMKLNEVVIYLNGGMYLPQDTLNENFVNNMFASKVLFFPRNASKRPPFLDLLEQKGGTRELPQLWVKGQLVGSGEELNSPERVYELCTPCRRPWPREGPYHLGCIGYEGLTRSDLLNGVPKEGREAKYMPY